MFVRPLYGHVFEERVDAFECVRMMPCELSAVVLNFLRVDAMYEHVASICSSFALFSFVIFLFGAMATGSSLSCETWGIIAKFQRLYVFGFS